MGLGVDMVESRADNGSAGHGSWVKWVDNVNGSRGKHD